MKVLVVGEMSGAASELVLGFKNNGCLINHIGFSNIFRNIHAQVNLSEFRGIYGIVDRFFKINKVFFKTNYDLIIFVRYWKFSEFDPINDYLFSRLRQKTKLFIFWSLSCDKVVRDSFKISSPLCGPCLLGDSRSVCKYEEVSAVVKENLFKKYIDIIATGTIEYKEAYDLANVPNVFIPMGIFIENNFKVNFDFSRSKFNVYHSKSAIGYKGSEIFEKAVSNNVFQKKFNFIIKERLPLDQHLINISNSDIIFDQLYNRSLGMNCLQILKSGRVLMCGKLNEDFGNFISPFIFSKSEEGLTESLIDAYMNFDKYKKSAPHNFDILFEKYNSTKIANDFLNLI